VNPHGRFDVGSRPVPREYVIVGVCRDRVEGSMSARSGARPTRSLISRDRQDRTERAA
jgi:hypothetical protein